MTFDDFDKQNPSIYNYDKIKYFVLFGLYIITLFLINTMFFLPIKLIICLIRKIKLVR